MSCAKIVKIETVGDVALDVDADGVGTLIIDAGGDTFRSPKFKVTTWQPLYFNKEYNKYSMKVTDDKLKALLNNIDNCVINEFKGKIKKEGIKHSNLIKPGKSGDYVTLNIGPSITIFDDNKKAVAIESLQTGMWEGRMVFSIGKTKVFRKYLTHPVFVGQLQIKPKTNEKVEYNECLFSDSD